MNNIGIIGLGFVGSAILKSFKIKNYSVEGYDKYKDGGIGNLQNMFKKTLLFLCLPTPYNDIKKFYDISSLNETCQLLKNNNFEGYVIIKSTVEPNTTNNLSEKYGLKLIHNPEFLSAATAFHDFHNQKHIVLGKGINVSDSELKNISDFYCSGYPNAEISLVDSVESEAMKLFANSFYATKIQFFNELYLLCQSINCNYDLIKNLMLKNKWINPMHTNVPGKNGQLSYGGYCFPKDTNALLSFMKLNKSKFKVLEAVITERNEMR